ncbi:uncharacterized protein NESG_02287 [Nematocida ausubeli]|uniref:PDZ GRASP-type domain-containing protein n=1 Tax=Nematocida ausubeli (strain ATCC PRA-371 / ERTm2) TaxID=1913371 RepID=A0A086J043_NEMA1|nr:uncharacterized protein NESG_02287 [Nematocida ausubeli]KFG25511.1 hypothetical protein NESG_02287 [Nematocida ausubeli]
MGSTASKCVSSSLHVIKVKKGSAADRHRILPILHYITQVNGECVQNEKDIRRITEAWEAGQVQLLIYDARSKKESVVEMTRKDRENIGFSIKLHKGEMVPQTFRILDVEYNSPALESRLRKDEDYIIGHEKGAFVSEDEFEHVLLSHKGAPLILQVYNIGMLSIRKVKISPTQQGEIGCSLGGGILNEVPYTEARIDLVEKTECSYKGEKAAKEKDSASSINESQKSGPVPSLPDSHAEESTQMEEVPIDSPSAVLQSEQETAAEQNTVREKSKEEKEAEEKMTASIQEMRIHNACDISSASALSYSNEGEEEERQLEKDLHQSLCETNGFNEQVVSPNASALEDAPMNAPVIDHITRISNSEYNDILGECDIQGMQDNSVNTLYGYDNSANIASYMLNGQDKDMYNYSNLPGMDAYSGYDAPYNQYLYNEGEEIAAQRRELQSLREKELRERESAVLMEMPREYYMQEWPAPEKNYAQEAIYQPSTPKEPEPVQKSEPEQKPEKPKVQLEPTHSVKETFRETVKEYKEIPKKEEHKNSPKETDNQPKPKPVASSPAPKKQECAKSPFKHSEFRETQPGPLAKYMPLHYQEDQGLGGCESSFPPAQPQFQPEYQPQLQPHFQPHFQPQLQPYPVKREKEVQSQREDEREEDDQLARQPPKDLFYLQPGDEGYGNDGFSEYF